MKRTAKTLFHLLLMIISCLAFTSALRAEADETTVLVALGQWQMRGGHWMVVVPLEGALTPKQKNIINGGFTTVSQLNIRTHLTAQDLREEAREREKDHERDKGIGLDRSDIVYKMRCSVKFDAWEETYDVARLDDAPRTATLRQMSQYGDLCLKAEITSEALLQKLGKEGGTLAATLVVKQMSADEAAKVKEWLIQQQSGVMQSLFSHMLGELTVNQTATVRISIPPRPEHGNAVKPQAGNIGTLARPLLIRPRSKG